VKNFLICLISNIIAIFLIVTNAYAYLDPGTGSFILQAIIGFLAALSAGFLYYWTKVKNFFLKFFKKNNNNEKTDNR
jgi:O-antigen/teichoic acid export membrane protein